MKARTVTSVRVRRTPTPRKGQCPARPPLDGVLASGRVVNAMLFCRLAKGHTGPHSWEDAQ